MPAHKMKDGRWCEWLDLGYDSVTGTRIRRRCEAKTKREAEMKAHAMRDRFRRGEDVLRKPRTVGDVLDAWLSTLPHQDLAANTTKAYAGVVTRYLKPALGPALVSKLRARQIQPLFNDLAARFAPPHIRQIKSVLVMALDLAIAEDEISVNAAKNVRIPTVKASGGRSLTPDEVRAVRAVCPSHRYGMAVELALLLGLRRAELSGLRWEDFDEVKGTLSIKRQLQRIDHQWLAVPPKDDSARVLTLGPKLTASLRQHRWNMAEERDNAGWPDSGYIFVSIRNGDLCPPSTIADAFKDIANTAGIAPAHLHDCRHTAATKLLSEGEDIGTVAEVLGHASPGVTSSVYAHALPHKVAGASKRLEDLYD